MKCKYCKNNSDKITGYFFSDGGSAETEGDFICIDCHEKNFKIPNCKEESNKIRRLESKRYGSRYRKKAIVISAIQWNGTNFDEIRTFTRNKIKKQEGIGGSEDGEGYPQKYIQLTIPTLEGDHLVSEGDWVIRGVKGEFYPCKPDIFKETYEEVKDESES